MDDGSPTLEVGFAIDTGGSFESLAQLQSVMGSAEAKIVADAANIERATSGMLNLSGATASIRSFGNAYSLEAQNIVRESARIEKAGERLVSQLERENAAFGKSRSELRQMKAEEAALAAERVGNSDLARRIREQETDLYGRELAVARQAAIGRANAAEDAAAAEVRAIAMVNAQLLEQNRLEAALQRTTRTDRPRATDAGATYSALAARAAEQEAAAATSAAAATAKLAREHDQLAAAVRGSHAAQEADAAAAERLRMATDPLYAATSRLNAEIAESTRLYYAGATAPAEYARQQQILTGRLQDVERQHAAVNRGFGTVGASGKLAGHHMQNLAFQFQDLGVQMAMAAGSSAPFKMAMMALFQQGTQISGIMSQAGIGIRGVGAAFAQMSKTVLLATVTNPILLGIAAAIAVVAGSIKLLQNAANDGADMKAYAASLGLTAKEIRNLDNVTVTYGDTAKAVFQVAGRAIWGVIGPAVTSVWDVMKDWAAWIGTGIKSAVNFMIGGFVGAYNIISKTWSVFPAVLGDIFFSAVNAAIGAINGLIKKSVSGVNGFIDAANGILEKAGLKLPHLEPGQISEVNNQYKGAYAKFGKTSAAEMQKAMGVDYLGKAGAAISGAVKEQARKNARDRIRAQAEEKGYLDPEKAKAAKTDKHAEALAREDKAIEAQIRNLYALADAYRVSGAAALIAEARVKAESDAIKKRGDIEMFVDRQIRLAIAQRVSDASKATAAVREQADAQGRVNALVAAGLVPAGRAADLVKDQIADLPLLAAIGAAQQRGLAVEATRATAALADQRAERERLAASEATARFNSATAEGANRLAEMREELRLIGATDAARTVALASLKATQEATAQKFNPADAAAYVAQQVAIATGTAGLATAQNNYNASLSYTRDLLGLIADQAGLLGNVLTEAFGGFGTSIGSAISALTDLQANQQSIADWKRDEVKKAGGDANRLAQIEVLAAKQSGAAQMKATTQALGAAKSLFREKSTGFKIISAIEKAYAAWQAAETIASMVRDATKTTSAVVNSGVRTTANTAEGGSKIFAELGPWAFPVVAAMVAVLAALGASAGGGGSSGPTMPSIDDVQAGQGTGSVLGDSKAKSESITRSLDIVASNTNRDLEYSNQMLSALRSIDFGISKMAGTIARQISVSGSLFDTSKLGLGTTGSGGFLGIGAKSTTKSLYDLGLNLNSGSVADILANGLGGSSYQTIEKIKKKSGFLGIGGGTKTSYSTTTGALDSDISNAIVGVISGLRSGILSAADVVGLQGAQALLDAFTVNVGKISLTGLSGTEIEEQLNAIFSKVGDDMATAVFPALKDLQAVGEGLFETFTRVAREYQVVDIALESIGKTFGSVGVGSIAARDELVQLFGSLDDFASATSAFRDAFLTDAEQIAPVAASVRAEMVRLGLAGIATRDQFKQAVLGLDLTTAAGRDMYASLLAVAPAFDKVLDYFDQANKAAIDGLKSTADQFNGFVASLTKYRDTLFATGASEAQAYQALRSKFVATSALAAGGDASALGGLEGAGKAFLDAARNNASTREDYLRDVAIVARGVDAGIFAADATADYAQLQYDALNNANSILGTISTNTAATAVALGAGAMVTAAGTTFAASAPSNDDAETEELRLALVAVSEELAQLRADTNAGNLTIATNTGRIARKLEDVTAASGGDAFAMVQPV